MQLQLQTFTTLVQNAAAAVQSAATQVLDLTVGSTLRAVLEANASAGLWMQWLILRVMQSTRAATCDTTDLDSWMADFSLTRLSAVSASGIATFSRYTATTSAFIPVGALVRTTDGTQTFSVSAVPSRLGFSTARNGYVLPAGTASLDVPILALNSGATGNVQASVIGLLVTAVPGVDTVTNTSAFQNGIDSESNSAFRARFSNFFDSRSRATPLAVGYAIANIQQNLEFTIRENMDPSGTPRIGSFVVTVDDGSGNPSASLLAAVTAAVDAMRPIGSIFAVQPPTTIRADVTLSISTAPGTSHIATTLAVAGAIGAFINKLPIGAVLPFTKIVQLAYAADPNITNVTQVNINGTVADITPPISGVIKAGTVAVN